MDGMIHPFRVSLSRSSVSVSFILLAFVLSSSRTHSQYFDIGDGETQNSPSALKGEDCTLPGAWEGNWFQSGVHNLISISNRSIISTKGQCIETDGDKFLFYNPVDKCFRCVVFHEKHRNVLQYKETYCHQSRRSLRSLCSTIQADYHLMSMFRLDAVPVPCPFTGSFTLSYNRGYGNCVLPVSTLNSCIHPTRIVFNYQACPDIHGTESANEEVECFATWKESSSRYLLGLIRYHYPASYEERFRCFVYEKEGSQYGAAGPTASSLHGRRASGRGSKNSSRSTATATTENEVEVFRVAQSGDATCLGLAPNEGSKTLVLKRVISKPCQFPSWLLRHTHWESLSRGLICEFESSTVRIGNFSTYDGDGILTQAVCTQIIHHEHEDEDGHENENTNQATTGTGTGTKTSSAGTSENLTDKITLVLHSTTECQTGFMCMAIHKRESHIIEIQTGRLSRRLENACHKSYFDPTDAPYVTLTSPTPESRECPFLTTFDISSISSTTAAAGASTGSLNCRDNSGGDDGAIVGSFSMGCDKLDVIELETKTGCRHANGKVAAPTLQNYKCLGWWEEATGENYLVASSATASASAPAKNSSLGGGWNVPRRNYETRSCFVFYEITPASASSQLSSLSLLHSSRRTQQPLGRKNQEIHLQQQRGDRENDDDGNNNENEQDSDDEEDESDDDDVESKDKDKESHRKRNLRRQFHFVRFEESCERRRQRLRPQRQEHGQDQLLTQANDGVGAQIGLVFNASTGYYYENNCHTAASSRKSEGGETSSSSSLRTSESIFASAKPAAVTAAVAMILLLTHPVLR